MQTQAQAQATARGLAKMATFQQQVRDGIATWSKARISQHIDEVLQAMRQTTDSHTLWMLKAEATICANVWLRRSGHDGSL